MFIWRWCPTNKWLFIKGFSFLQTCLFLGHPTMDRTWSPINWLKARLLIGTARWFCNSIGRILNAAVRSLACTLHHVNFFAVVLSEKNQSHFQLCLNLKSVKKNLFQNTCSRDGLGSKMLNSYIVKCIQAFQTIQLFLGKWGVQRKSAKFAHMNEGFGF